MGTVTPTILYSSLLSPCINHKVLLPALMLMSYFLSKLQTTNTTELLCLCRLIQMDHEHIPQQVLYWDVPGQTRTNWRDVVKKDHEHIPQQVLYWGRSILLVINVNRPKLVGMVGYKVGNKLAKFHFNIILSLSENVAKILGGGG